MASGRPGAGGAQQPSFKTNVNRMKTKRWVEAKSYSYDGDDWGEADEYDEYDGYDDPPQAALPGPAASARPASGNYGQPAPPHAPYARQTGPQPSSPGRPPYAQDPRERSGSFGRGDEHRSFVGPPGSGSPRINPIHTAYGTPPAPGSPMGRGSPLGTPGYQQGRSSMEGQPRPSGRPFAAAENYDRTGSFTSQTGGASFAQRRDFASSESQPQQLNVRPPRQSSLGQDNTPAPPAAPASDEAASTMSPTFVRPADIYKRLAQEREKERVSQDSSRPSMSDIEASRDNLPTTKPSDTRPKQHGLETVAERKSEYIDNNVLDQRPKGSMSPQLPEFDSEGGFSLDFSSGFQGSSEAAKDAQRRNIIAAQEAARQDVSMREADIAKKTTDLSHQPSQGFRSVVHQAFDEPVAATPSGSDIGRSDTTSTSAISPIITRNPSKEQQEANAKAFGNNMVSIAEEMSRGSSEEPPLGLRQGHRRSLDPPSSGSSPARQPKLEVKNIIPSPESGAIDESSSQKETAARQRSASAAKASAIQSVVESLSQKVQESIPSQPSPTRSESPTKGRVRDLVDKAESASSSRRGSQSSLQGLTPGQERAEGIRPQLPGGWNSYTTNEATPGDSPQLNDITAPRASQDDVELEPTTERRSVSGPSVDPSQGPLQAAKAAGAALAGSIAAAAGMEVASNSRSIANASAGSQPRHYAAGQSYNPDANRPLMPPPTDSTISSIMPTPKGYSPSQSAENLTSDVPAVAPLRQRVGGGPSSAVLPTPDVQHSATTPQKPSSPDTITESSPIDDNDELRREIVRQLSPNAPSPGPENRDARLEPSVGVSAGQPSGMQLVDEEPKYIPSRPLRQKFSWEEGSEDLNAPVVAPQREATPSSTYRAPKTFGSILGGGHAPASAPVEQPRAAPEPAVKAPVQAPVQAPYKAPYQAPFSPSPAKPQIPMEKQASSPGLPAASSPVIKPTETSVNNIQSHVVTVLPEALPTKEPEPPTPTPQDEPVPESPDSVPSSPREEEEPIKSPVQGARQPGQGFPPGQAPIPPFRDILAMKSPEDRIRVYRNTQDTFYHMNTGLSDWIRTMGDRHPEHKGLIESRGQFTTPTPGMPTSTRAQQPGNATSGPSFGGLRKPGATAAPAINDAGAALKSAGRDTKKLAKGLFAKGRSKFSGKDKAFPKAASIPKPLHPVQQQQAQPSQYNHPPESVQPFRPVAQIVQPVSEAQRSQVPHGVQMAQSGQNPNSAPHFSQMQDSTSVQPEQASPRSHPLSSTSQALRTAAPSSDNRQHNEDLAVAPDTYLNVAEMKDPVQNTVSEKQLPLPPKSEIEQPDPFHDAPVDSEPFEPQEAETSVAKVIPLRQRLTVHQKDMKPFEVSFPADLTIPEKFRETLQKGSESPSANETAKSTVLPSAKSPAITSLNGAQSTGSTPDRNEFPTRQSSKAYARTLDPGSAKSSHPSWLNFTPPLGTPRTIAYLANLGSENSSPSTSKLTNAMASPIPAAPTSAPASIPQMPPSITEEPSEVIKPSTKDLEGKAPSEEERPFSFINFGDQSPADLALKDVKYEPLPPRRQSSVFTASSVSADLISAVSTQDHAYEGDANAAAVMMSPSTKPLPELPPVNDRNKYPAPASASQNTSDAEVSSPRKARQSFSLFPPNRSRSGTLDSMAGDYGPYAVKPQQPATMPAPVSNHRRNRSGSATNLLQRALTNLPGSSSPRKERAEPELEKTQKRRRRFSGLGLGNLIQQAKGTLRGTASPAPHHSPYQQQQYRAYTPRSNQDGSATQAAQLSQGYRPYTPQDAARNASDASYNDARQDSQTKSNRYMYNSQYYPAQYQPDVRTIQGPMPSSTPIDKNFGMKGPIPLGKMVNAEGPASPSTPTSKFNFRKASTDEPRRRDGQSLEVQESLSNAQAEDYMRKDSLNTQDLEPSPRPSSSRHSPNLSTNAQESTWFPGHRPSHSNASVMSKRSHAPSLSINTSIASPVPTIRQASQPSLQPHSQTNGAVSARSANSSNRDQGGSDVASRQESRRPSDGPQDDGGEGEAAAHENTHPIGEAAAPEQIEFEDDDCPSDLDQLADMEPQPASAMTRASGWTSATPASTVGVFSPPPIPDMPEGSFASDRRSGRNGNSNRIALTAAALRIARQREIELGGETRMNSPEPTPESAGIGKRLGYGSENIRVMLDIQERVDGIEPEDKLHGDEPSTNEETRNDEDRKGKGAETTEQSGVQSTKQDDRGSIHSSHDEEEEEEEEEKKANLVDVKQEKMLAPKHDDDEIPAMSATSFPGQEWNPYEGGIY